MTSYKTEQRKLLYAFLAEHPDEQFSAKDIAGALSGHPISLSAVYRNLATMADDGLISRAVRVGSREILYRFTGADGCRGALHLTCTECGRISHMSKSIAESMLDRIAAAEGFQLNRTKTVLYGVCQDCSCES